MNVHGHVIVQTSRKIVFLHLKKHTHTSILHLKLIWFHELFKTIKPFKCRLT